MQQQKSPIWAIDLFERRQFRNGNEEAQCMECGKSFNSCELAAMTAHIVDKHPQYAAKLLAKQLEFDGGSCHLQQITKVERAEETECPTSTTPKCPTPANTDANLMTRTTPTAPTNYSPSSELDRDGRMEGTTTNASVPFVEISSSAVPPAQTTESANDTKLKEGDDGNCCFDYAGRNGSTPATFSTTSSVTSASHQSESKHSPPRLTPNFQNANAVAFVRASASPATIPNFSPLSALLDTTNAAEDSSFCTLSTTTATPTTARHPKAETTAQGTDEASSDGNNPAIFKDKFGKEWRLLVPTDVTHLDQIADQNFLRRKGTPKYDGRIYLSCCWSGRSSSAEPCPHRGLFLPERQALFYRRTHNHPTATTPAASAKTTPKTAPKKQQNASAKRGRGGGCCSATTMAQQRQSRCCTSNEDTVSAFSAALPDIDNANSEEHKISVVNTELVSHSLAPPSHCDKFGKQWRWLFHLDDIDKDPERIRKFRQAYFLTKKNTYLKNVFFNCKFRNRRKGTCPFRAVYVAKRRAMFAFQSHNHPPPQEEDNDMAANEATGCFQQRGQAQQQHVIPVTKNIDNIPISSNKESARGFDGSLFDSFINTTVQFDDYIDNSGKSWKLMANLDVGECETVEERHKFTDFCNEHWLYRFGRRNADGTLRIYSLICKEWRTTKCPYRAIYVVDRRAVFDRKMHNHSIETGTNGPRARGVAKKGSSIRVPTCKYVQSTNNSFSASASTPNAVADQQSCSSSFFVTNDIPAAKSAIAMPVNAIEKSDNAGGNAECCHTPAQLSAGCNDDGDYVDFVGKTWHRLTSIDLGECKSQEHLQKLRTFCHEHGLHRGDMRWKNGGILRLMSFQCKHKLRKCPFRAVYVVERRAVFGLGSHDHTMVQKRTVRRKRKKRLVFSNSGGTKMGGMPTKMANWGTNFGVEKCESPFLAPPPLPLPPPPAAGGGGGQYPMNFSELCSSSSVPPPPVVVDQCDRPWNWLANLPDASSATVLDFRRHFCVKRKWSAQDGSRVTYWCQYRLRPIGCPFKIMHLIGRNVLYHRNSHNHSVPLSSEQAKDYRRQRNTERKLSLKNSKFKTLAQSHCGEGIAKEEEKCQSEQNTQCSGKSDENDGTANGGGTEMGGAATDDPAMSSAVNPTILIKTNSSG
ncbi:hypothetical protein niasHT_025012 [Heterodera trifolii]|uniref:Uncharacterized protein n=1 Tax=Heterodera trifolii TaxID=157864 RepID=A0ABD2KTN8_9BILA